MERKGDWIINLRTWLYVYIGISVVSSLYFWFRKGMLNNGYITKGMYLFKFVPEGALFFWWMFFLFIVYNPAVDTRVVGWPSWLEGAQPYIEFCVEWIFIVVAFLRLGIFIFVLAAYIVIGIIFLFVLCGVGLCQTAVESANDAKERNYAKSVMNLLEPTPLILIRGLIADDKCSVCDEKMNDDTEVYLMTCNEHPFHIKCAEKSLE